MNPGKTLKHCFSSDSRVFLNPFTLFIFRNVLGAVQAVYARDGLTGFYRGYSAMVCYLLHKLRPSWNSILFRLADRVHLAFGKHGASSFNVTKIIWKQCFAFRLVLTCKNKLTRLSVGLDIISPSLFFINSKASEGLYMSGWCEQVLRDVPYSALQFLTFEVLRKDRQGLCLLKIKDQGFRSRMDLINDLWMGAVSIRKQITDSCAVYSSLICLQICTLGWVGYLQPFSPSFSFIQDNQVSWPSGQVYSRYIPICL